MSMLPKDAPADRALRPAVVQERSNIVPAALMTRVRHPHDRGALFWRASWMALSIPTTAGRDERQGDDDEPLAAGECSRVEEPLEHVELDARPR